MCRLRTERKLGPRRLGPLLEMPASTVHAVLTWHGLHRLAWLDRPTGTPVRRYERDRPGELIHVDVKKLGRLRDGGWRGDRVVITRADGHTVTFSVDWLGEFRESYFPTQLVYGSPDYPALRLITCGGVFDRSAGSYRDNIVVFAHLTGHT